MLHVCEREHEVAGERRIVVDATVELFVVDVIEFDADAK